jgi:predicted metal-dependent peptidase
MMLKPKLTLAQFRELIPIAEKYLSACWTPLAMRHPIWMPSIMGLEWKIWDFDMPGAPSFIPTACTDGHTVWINPEFFVGLSPKQRVFLIGHELLHPLLNHLTRLSTYAHHIQNRAADFEINNMLRDYMAKSPDSMEWIDGGISDGTEYSYKGMASEAIATDLLKKELEQEKEDKDDDGDPGDDGNPGDGNPGDGNPGDGNPGNGNGDSRSDEDRFNEARESGGRPGRPGKPGKGKGNGKSSGSGDPGGDPGGDGDGDPSPGEFITPPPGSAAARELGEKWTEIAANTANAARLAGNAPGSWLEKIEGTLTSPIDLETILARFLSDYTFGDEGYRAHRPTLHDHGFCIPDDYVEAHGTLVFVKDTSGSVNTKEASVVLGCIEAAAAQLNARRFVVLDVDTAVTNVQELLPGDSISREFKGRGGTDFRPAFKWVDTNADDCRVLLYFTDGEGCFPDVSPDYPVIWINFNKHSITYPWGDVVDISQFTA